MRVHSIVRVLLVAAVAVAASGVRAEDAETQTIAVDTEGAVDTMCVAPDVVSNYETKLDALEAERAQWQSQLVAANGQWKKEKVEIEEKLAQVQAKAKKDLKLVKQEAAAAVEKLKKELSERAKEHAATVEKLEKQLSERAEEHATAFETVEKMLSERAQEHATAVKTVEEQLSEQAREYDAAVEKLEKELSERAKEHAETVAKLEKQVGESKSQHSQTLEQLKEQVAALEKTVTQLKTQVAEQKVVLGKRDAEVSEARAKLVKSQDQVKTLERDVASSRKKNQALRDELQKLDEKLTISALLSSYYDEGVVLASNAVTALRLQIESAQEGTSGVSQALEALETYKKTVTETTDKLYAEHLAATVDPLIADLRRASDPYVKQYQPLVEAEFTRAKKVAIQNYNVALARATAARAEAITLLKQTDGVAPYAQKIVDGSLVVLATPIAFLLLRLVLSLAWFLASTTFCVITLGYCCGLCARKRKAKRKGSRKPQSPSPTPTTTTAPSSSKKTTSASASSNTKRGKKQK